MTDTLKQWIARNVTFSLVLAVFTEVPRWVFAFDAINEPLWAGVPLAVLIAFATAHAWEEYFTQHDWLLLGLNVVSLIFAVFTIAPVLYTMIERIVEGESVHLTIADVFPPFVQGMWVTVLACTTFLPLIQLAVVEARRRARPQPQTQLIELMAQPVTQPVIAEPAIISLEPVLTADVAEDDMHPLDATMQLETQLEPVEEQLLSALDEMDERIVDAIRNGSYTPYAISKATGIASTTLKRKDGDKVKGRLPQLIAKGIIHNSSGVDGSEYRLAE